LAAVKVIDRNKVKELKDKHLEDPIKEVAAMQFFSREGGVPNILPCWDLFLDERYIYMCMPFCSKGELFDFVKRNGRFEESIARYWFKQLLNVSI
jgi:serine/threonine protein kinase